MEYGPSGVLAQRDHNVHAFLAALSQIKQVPSDCMFSIADLEAEHEERPQVANCLIFIRHMASSQRFDAAAAMNSPFQQAHSQQFHHQQQQHHYGDNLHGSVGHDDHMVTPPPLRSSCNGRLQHLQQQQYGGMVTPPSVGHYGHNSPSTRLSFAGTTPGSAGSFGAMLHGRSSAGNHQALPQPLQSPLMEGHGSLSHSHGGSMVPYRSSSSSLTPASMQGASLTAATHKSVQAAAGVTRLMQQCTSMLKERMFPNEQGVQRISHAGQGSTPDTAMRALGPVLEGVLGQLTEEYERRLLTKDHELSKAQEAQRRAEQELQRLQVSPAAACMRPSHVTLLSAEHEDAADVCHALSCVSCNCTQQPNSTTLSTYF